MRLRTYLTLSISLIFLVVQAFAGKPTEPITSQQLIARMSTAIQSLKTLRCFAEAEERVGRSIVSSRTIMKLSFNPLMVYLKNQKNVEVLYATGQNDNEAWVYPSTFPYLTLSLAPTGSLMRKGQHHTVLQAGFGMIADLLSSTSEEEAAFTRSFRYAGDTVAQGQIAYILRSDYPRFHYLTYKARRGETIASIAGRFGCGEYRILERNKLDVDSKLTEGQVLQVPNAYGRRVILVINSQNYLPFSVTVYDDQGLYEKYTFLHVIANQPIAAAEFSKHYQGYKF